MVPGNAVAEGASGVGGRVVPRGYHWRFEEGGRSSSRAGPPASGIPGSFVMKLCFDGEGDGTVLVDGYVTRLGLKID